VPLPDRSHASSGRQTAAPSPPAAAHARASRRGHADCGCDAPCGLMTDRRNLPALHHAHVRPAARSTGENGWAGSSPPRSSRFARTGRSAAKPAHRQPCCQRTWSRHGFGDAPQALLRPCRAGAAFSCGWGHPQSPFRNVAQGPAPTPILPKQKPRDRSQPVPPSCPCRAGGVSRPCACLSTPPRFSAVRRDWGLSLKLSTEPRKAPRPTHAAGLSFVSLGKAYQRKPLAPNGFSEKRAAPSAADAIQHPPDRRALRHHLKIR
jgi:hypothetical protein